MHAPAYAKVNIGLVVGPARSDGKHEIVTVLERIDVHDVVELERAQRPGIVVDGFADDTLVRSALERFSEATDARLGWRARIEKRIPVASGLGGGSSDAAVALRLANELSGKPLSQASLHALAAALGSDVPFFLTPGAKLATGNGTELEPIELPRAYWAVLALAHDARKLSTASVYDAFDADVDPAAFADARRAFRETLELVGEPRDLARLAPNQLVSNGSSLRSELADSGAFRVDASGAGPMVYGLFEHEDGAQRAERGLRSRARTWLTRPIAGP